MYVVVIAAAANTLAHDITPRSVTEFAVVFGLIWFSWVNGASSMICTAARTSAPVSTRLPQMLLIVLLGVYVGDAAGDGGRGFALVYSAYLMLLTWLWYTVRHQDDERFMDITRQYLNRMVLSVVAMVTSAFLPGEVRMIVWALLLAMSLMTMIRLGGTAEMISESGMLVSNSMVERFGLFVIIVLGEVIVGVVDGLLNVEREAESILTGMFALILGFGLWWNLL